MTGPNERDARPSALSIYVMVAAGCVFAALAARETTRPYEHAWAVWVALMVLSFLLNAMCSVTPRRQRRKM